MRRRSTLLCAAAFALPLATLSAPTGASAAEDHLSRVVLHDPTGDVWAIPGEEGGGPVSAGDAPTADVIRAMVRHGRGNVVVKMTFTDLRRVSAQSYDVRIVGPGLFKSVVLYTVPGQWRGRDQLFEGETRENNCPKLVHSIDYDTEQVTIWIPRVCIGRPEWVKVGMDNMMFPDDDMLMDTPHGPGVSSTRRLYQADS